MENTQKMAVLIDADNTQLSKLEDVFHELTTYGRLVVKKAYGNWKKQSLKNWEEEVKRLAIKTEQQFDYVSGKNTTDIAMVIDAMDLLHSGMYDAFALVSSDSDFTPLAIRLRESGAYIIGVGETKTPEAFRNACDDFLLLDFVSAEVGSAAFDSGDLYEDAESDAEFGGGLMGSCAHEGGYGSTAESAYGMAELSRSGNGVSVGGASGAGTGGSASLSGGNTAASSFQSGNAGSGSRTASGVQDASERAAAEAKRRQRHDLNEVHKLLRIAFERYQDEDGFVNTATSGNYIKRAKPDFTPALYGYSKLSDFLKAFPKKYELKSVKGKGKGSSTAVFYRCKGK